MTDPIFATTDADTGKILRLYAYDQHNLHAVIPNGDDPDSVVVLPRGLVVELRNALTGWLVRTDRHIVHAYPSQNAPIGDPDLVTDNVGALNEQIAGLKAGLDNRGQRLAELEKLQEKHQSVVNTNLRVIKERDEALDKIDELQDQLDAARAVPPEQSQRAAALQTARDVAQNLTPAGGFGGKQGREARQPDVLALAHFILTGQRDYVTREGEYVERYADHLPTISTPSGELRLENPDGGFDTWTKQQVTTVVSDRDEPVEAPRQRVPPDRALLWMLASKFSEPVGGGVDSGYFVYTGDLRERELDMVVYDARDEKIHHFTLRVEAHGNE